MSRRVLAQKLAAVLSARQPDKTKGPASWHPRGPSMVVGEQLSYPRRRPELGWDFPPPLPPPLRGVARGAEEPPERGGALTRGGLLGREGLARGALTLGSDGRAWGAVGLRSGVRRSSRGRPPDSGRACREGSRTTGCRSAGDTSRMDGERSVERLGSRTSRMGTRPRGCVSGLRLGCARGA
jgi:hypothetical protein